MAQDLQHPQAEGEFPRPEQHFIDRIFFTPDSKQLVAYGKDRKGNAGFIDFWDVKTRKLVRTLQQPGHVSAVALSPDGKLLVTAGWDNKLRIFTAPKWQIEHTFDHDPPGQTANWLAIFPDAKRFVSVNVGYSGPRIWNLNDRQALPLIAPREQGHGLHIAKDGKRFAVAYSAPVTEVWDAKQLEVVGRLELQPEGRYRGVFSSVAFSPNGKTIATGYLRGTCAVAIWNAETFKKLHDCYGFDEPDLAPNVVAYSADSKFIIACSAPDARPARLMIWDVETGKIVYQFATGKDGGGRALALSPDGRWLAHCTQYGVLQLWDFAKIRREFEK